MYEIRQTKVFSQWFDQLKDPQARRHIARRIVRLEAGLLGDVKFFQGIGELRIDQGPGYRVYFKKRGNTLIFLLSGGSKRSQKKDIEAAIQMSKDL